MTSDSMTTLIHPTAVIHPNADLHPTVQVGAYAVIGARVKVGAGTTIGHHVVLDGWTELGARNQIYPGAAIGLEPQDLKYDGSESLVRLGNDNCIREYVTINRPTFTGEVTSIGDRNLLMAYAHVGHNCLLENDVIIANSVALSGHVHIESNARISGVLGVHQFVHIGRMAMVGGMARISRDVPPFMMVEGNPAYVRSLNLVGLKRTGLATLDEGDVLRSLKQSFRILYRSGLSLNESLDKLDSLFDNDYVQHLSHFLRQSQEKGRRGPTPGRRKVRSQDDE